MDRSEECAKNGGMILHRKAKYHDEGKYFEYQGQKFDTPPALASYYTRNKSEQMRIDDGEESQ